MRILRDFMHVPLDPKTMQHEGFNAYIQIRVKATKTTKNEGCGFLYVPMWFAVLQIKRTGALEYPLSPSVHLPLACRVFPRNL